MKSIIKFFTLGTIIINSYAFSQNGHNLVRNNSRAALQDVGFLLNSNTEKIDAIGSPHLTEDFLPIKIKGFKNTVFLGRFNANSGQMEIKTDEDKIIYLDNEKFHEVTFTTLNKTYKTCSYVSNEEKQERGFLEIIHKGEGFTLLKQEIIKFYDKVPAKSGYETDKPAQFKKENDKFYIYFEGSDSITYMPSSKKNLMKSYPKDAKKLKSFLKNEKISLNDEDDLVKLAEYLSSLKIT